MDPGVAFERDGRDPPDTVRRIPSRARQGLLLFTRLRQARALVVTVPVLIVSTLTVTLGLAPPAAATTPKRTDRIDRGRWEGSRTLGDRLLPRSSVAAPTLYTVVEGDTISGIAARYGLPTARVLALNGLSWKSLIFPGQNLTLTGGDLAAASIASAPEIVRYTVVPGDTVSGIASRHRLQTAILLAANGLDRSSVIYPGQTLVLPDGNTLSAAAVPAPAVSAPATSAEPVPVPIDAVPPLTDQMRSNALLIVQIGREESVPDAGIVIALAAAMQESGLRNLAFGDRDSLGLFQQRPSAGWGTPQQIMDPATAIRSFYGGADHPRPGLTKGLLDITGWQTMSLPQAAHAVQLSSEPERYGRWTASATAWLAELS